MKEIQLTQGQVALVDDEDYEWLNQWQWQADKSNDTYYAIRSSKKTDGDYDYKKRRKIKMHRVILGLSDPSIEGDHIDHNGLNNQRQNLRPSTPQQNRCNSSKRKNYTSKYKGVSWYNKTKKWKAQIQANKKKLGLGYFWHEEEAAREYDKKAKELHGEYANLNFPYE